MGQMERVIKRMILGALLILAGLNICLLTLFCLLPWQMEIVRQDGYAGSLARYTIFHHLPVFAPLLAGVILLIYKPVVTALRKARLVPQSHTPVQSRGGLNAGFLLFSLALLATFVTLALVLMDIL